MTKDQQLTAWLTALDAGDITPAQVLKNLIQGGATPDEAAEILYIHAGGSDTIDMALPDS